MKWLVAGAVLILVGAGGVGAQPPPPGYAPIPPPRAEMVPSPPRARTVWEPGHWHWDGVRYVWRPGRYVTQRPQYHHYVEGQWVWGPRQGRWFWRPAHWE